MRRLILIACLCVGSVMAQIPGDMATEHTQLLNYVTLGVQYARQGIQLSTAASQLTKAIDTYNEIVRQGQLLRGIQWTSASQDLLNIAVIARQGQALAFSMANLDQQFRATYPGFVVPGAPYSTRYRNWAQTALDTIQGTLLTTGSSWGHLQREQSMIQFYQGQAQGLTTQQQALMTGNEIGAETLNQTNKLRQLMMADMQSKQAFAAYQVQKDMSAHNSEQTFFAPGRAGRDNIGW